MAKLELAARPFVEFNEENKQHRRWYFEFIKHQTWGKLPCRFVVQDEQGDLVSMIERKMLAYYNQKEFGKENA